MSIDTRDHRFLRLAYHEIDNAIQRAILLTWMFVSLKVTSASARISLVSCENRALLPLAFKVIESGWNESENNCDAYPSLAIREENFI